MIDPEAVEAYIQSLKWSDQATEWEKMLVAGNIRAFANHVRELEVETGPVGLRRMTLTPQAKEELQEMLHRGIEGCGKPDCSVCEKQ